MLKCLQKSRCANVSKSRVEHNPEREIDRCAEQVQHHCVKGSVPVHHGQGEDDQLRQTLQQKNTDREIDFVRTFTLKVRSTNAPQPIFFI